MTASQYDWDIQLIKDLYEELNLTTEQAKKIYLFEEEKRNRSKKNDSSVWEEWDLNMATFRIILDQAQATEYEKWVARSRGEYEKSLMASDLEQPESLAYNEKISNYYEEIFIPGILASSNISMIELAADKSKIEFLKAEYKLFLNERRKKILRDHFRHYRLFRPNQLRSELQRQKLFYLWPDYNSFKASCDEATRAVLEHVKTQAGQLPKPVEKELTVKYEELGKFQQQMMEKYYGDMEGWHVIIGKSTPEQVNEYRYMTLLLLDPDMYDYAQLFEY